MGGSFGQTAQISRSPRRNISHPKPAGMESRRHHQRSRNARGPPLPPHHHQLSRHHAPPHHPRQNPSLSPAAAASHVFHPRFQFQMEEFDAASTLMDIDDSPLGAGLLDDEDGEGELFFAPHRGGRGGAAEVRGPLAFSTFYNNFDGADFDDADLA